MRSNSGQFRCQGVGPLALLIRLTVTVLSPPALLGQLIAQLGLATIEVLLNLFFEVQSPLKFALCEFQLVADGRQFVNDFR